MPTYLARARYASEINGRRFAVAAGDVVELSVDDIGPLWRDAPDLFDLTAPLTAADVERIQREKEQERVAAHLAAVLAERELVDAIRAHERAWNGSRCPGRPDTMAMPVGYGNPDASPHYSGELEAEKVAAGWLVGCPFHLPNLVARGVIPTPPPLRDRVMHDYLVRHRYRATFTEHAPEGSPFGSARDADLPKRFDFTAGEVVQLPGWVAEWVERDSPGALERIEG